MLTRSLAALVACCGCLVPVLTWADDAQALSPRKLGIADAILEYCKKAYPSSNDKWQFEVDRLTHGASKDTVDKARNSDAYRQARAAEASFVAQIEPINAKHVCAKSLAKKPANGKPADDKPADQKSAQQTPAADGSSH
jgi:hypothetical protein